MTSRYILELNGAPSVSSTSNSTINIPNIAGSNSNVAIDLSTLNTVGAGYNAPTETGCIVGNITEYGNNTTVNTAATCNAVAQLIQSASCKTAATCAPTGGTSATDIYGNDSYIGSTSTAISSIYADYDGTSCKVVITDGNCSTVNGNISANSYQNYCGLDSNNSTGGTTDCPTNDYILQDDGTGSGNVVNVSASVSTGGSVSVPGTAKCEFDAYKMRFAFASKNFLPTDSTCSTNSDGSGNTLVSYGSLGKLNSFRDELLYWMNNNETQGTNANNNLNTSNTTATFNTDHCHFIVNGYDCNHISLEGLDHNVPYVFFLDSSGNQITSTQGSTSTPGTTTKTGCLIGTVTFAVGSLVTDQAGCNSTAQLIQDSSCKASDNCASNGTSATDLDGNLSITGSTNTAIQNIYANYASSACQILIADGDNTCSAVNVEINTNSHNTRYCGLDFTNSTGGRTDCPADSYLLQDDGISNNVSVTASASSNGSITIGTSIPDKTLGIDFTCGSDSSIQYNYNFFDVFLENSCSNTDKSYLIFTPKSTSIGTHSLGSSINGDGSVNSPFTITHIENQNGDFYIEPICDTSGTNPILLSALDNVVLG